MLRLSRIFNSENKMLKGKNVIVTGSTSGIGLSIATCFADNGANVMLNGLGSDNDIEKLLAELRNTHKVKVEFSAADMTKPTEIAKMIKQTETKLGSVDILVNNAGIQFISRTEDFPDEKWDAVIAINLSASFHAIKHALPGMIKRKFGRIINIASVHGLIASANKPAYVAAKHGIIGLTKAVAIENANSPITSNAICPGWVKTPLVEMQIEKIAKEKNISMKEAEAFLLAEGQPSLRFVDPKEIAELAVFLASDNGKNITGSAITIDGGWTAH